MHRLSLVVSYGLLALILSSTLQAPRAQETRGKNCRMEQQCHWKDFKKICVWVKVCR